MANLNSFVDRVLRTVEAHRHLPGQRYYERYLSPAGAPLAKDVYGTADALNILYTLGELPDSESDRSAWREELLSFQDPSSGAFLGLGHDEIHSTAFGLSALALVEGKSRYPLTLFESYRDAADLSAFLASLDWTGQPWAESLKGAGLYASLVLSDSVTEEWERAYFDWLYENADPASGLWRIGSVGVPPEEGGAPLFHHVAGSFHYLFNLAHRNEPIRYPERILDTCIALYESGELDEYLTNAFSYFHVDWSYTFRQCMRLTGHRREECLNVLHETSIPFVEAAARLGDDSQEPFEDLHQLCGTVSGLAVIQQLLPELVQTAKPLQLVLDRRPFI